jgi:hypothetical protein
MVDATGMATRARNKRIEYIGNKSDDSILIGSYGNTYLKVEGTFDLSGIIYSPKYTVTLTVDGKGKISFRGICNTLIIRKMSGSCTIDLSQLVCKEMRCLSLKERSIVIAGRVRTISEASLYDNSVLYLTEKPLIINPVTSGNSRIELHQGLPQTIHSL